MAPSAGMNEPEQWIVIPNWKKFQHYGNRRSVPWIKVYNELNSRAEWLELPMAAKGWLVTIWIEYARASGVLSLSRVRRESPSGSDSKYFRVHMKALSDAGFIQFSASKPLAPRAPSREVDADKEQVPASRSASYSELESLAAILEQAGRPVENLEEPWN